MLFKMVSISGRGISGNQLYDVHETQMTRKGISTVKEHYNISWIHRFGLLFMAYMAGLRHNNSAGVTGFIKLE